MSVTTTGASPASKVTYASPLVRVLRLVRYPVLAATVFWLVTGLYAIHTTEGLVRTVGRDSTTSILAARAVATGVADAHAGFLTSVVNARSGGGAITIPSQGLDDVLESIVRAAGNVTYMGELGAILSVTKGISHYDDATARAESADPAQADKGIRDAGAIEGGIVQSAHELADINARQLDAAWAARSDFAHRSIFVMATAVLLGAMAFAQAQMTLRTRRVLNVYMAPATLIVALTSWVVAGGLSRASSDVTVARTESFASADTLWRVRTFAAITHEKVLASVVDAGDAPAQYQDKVAFSQTSRQITGEGGAAVIAKGITGGKLDGLLWAPTIQQDVVRDLSGLWIDLLKVEAGILEDVSASGITDPKALATREVGTLRSADETYGRFAAAAKQATGRTLAPFQAGIDDARDASRDLMKWMVVSTILAAVLSYLGIRQRLDEYGR